MSGKKSKKNEIPATSLSESMLWCLACILESVFLIDEFAGGDWLIVVRHVVALFLVWWQCRLHKVLLVPVEKLYVVCWNAFGRLLLTRLAGGEVW